MRFFFKRKPAADKMKAVIIGAGEVGIQVADHLASEEKDVTLIDINAEALKDAAETMDIKTVHGPGDSPVTLAETGIANADLVLAVTDSDATNIITCLFANKCWPNAVTLARIRNEDYTRGQEDLINDVLGINTLVNPELEVVKAIERMLSLPGIIDYNEFADGLVKMVSLQVNSGPMVDLKLLDFRSVVPEEDIIVAAIERDGKILVPSGETKIQAGDIVHFVTVPGILWALRRATDYYDREPAHSVFIIGGGNVALRLAMTLEEKGYSVKLADRDEERCKFLADTLDKTLVLRGDGTDQYFLKEENIGDMDAVVTLTNSDEVNVLIALLAKSLGVPHAIVRVNKKEYHHLVELVGLHYYVNPRTAAVNSILRYIRRGRVMASVALGEDAEVIEIIAQEGSKLLSAPLYELGLPKGALVLALVRNGVAIIPKGRQIIEADDRVLILAAKKVMSEVETFLTTNKDS